MLVPSIFASRVDPQQLVRQRRNAQKRFVRRQWSIRSVALLKDGWRSQRSQNGSGDIDVARVCTASSKLARAGRRTTPSVAGTSRVPDNPSCGHSLVDLVMFVCACAERPRTKHELQSAPIFSGLNMRRAPWSSVGPRVPASCFHRGMGEVV